MAAEGKKRGKIGLGLGLARGLGELAFVARGGGKSLHVGEPLLLSPYKGRRRTGVAEVGGWQAWVVGGLAQAASLPPQVCWLMFLFLFFIFL